MKSEMVRLVNGFLRREIRAWRSGQHQDFAQKNRVAHKYRAENHGQEKQIDQPVKFPGFPLAISLFTHSRGARAKLILSTT